MNESVITPGIQPSGALLGLSRDFSKVLMASANLQAILGAGGEPARGEQANRLRQQPYFEMMRQALDSVASVQQKFIHVVDALPGLDHQELQLTAWADGDRVFMEFEPLFPLGQRRVQARTNIWMRSLAQARTQDQVLDVLVRSIQDLVGYERIMALRFTDELHSEVMIEANRGPGPTYEGQYFHASQTFPDEHAHFAANLVQCVVDSGAQTVPVIILDDRVSPESVDLTPGILRAPPDAHTAYLVKRGVISTLTLAIEGLSGLWGQVNCLSSVPIQVHPTLRDAALTLVQMASQRLAFIASREHMRYMERVAIHRDGLVERCLRIRTPQTLLDNIGQSWMSLAGATGMTWVQEGKVSCVGQTPGEQSLLSICRHLTAMHHSHDAWTSHCLANSSLGAVCDTGDCHGLLAMALPSVTPPVWLLFFRGAAEPIRWAGTPVTPSLREVGKLEDEAELTSEPWQDYEIAAVAALAEDLSLAISVNRIDRLNKSLQEARDHYAAMARTDSLTGIWNRYFMEECLDNTLQSARARNRPCSVILFDIDSFKNINDTFGHAQGDVVLSRIANVLGAEHFSFRSEDVFGRWGGEEFVVITPENTLEEAAQLAERIRLHIANYKFAGVGPVTVSLGVSQWIPGESRKTLLNRADQAMYQAKMAGRNRVVKG